MRNEPFYKVLDQCLGCESSSVPDQNDHGTGDPRLAGSIVMGRLRAGWKKKSGGDM